jgi:geranylgeranyl diphosphate synthase type I
MGPESIVVTMRNAVEVTLKKIIADSIPAEYRPMSPLLTYHLGWEGEGAGPESQGKRIRPLIVLLCAASVCEKWRQALPAAAAVELIHNFSLIHDDIQDKSEIRRGRATVWVKWGVPQAINAGDLMFTLAQTAILQLCETVSLPVGLRSAELLNQTSIRLTGGQHLDMTYETVPELSLDAYWPMIEGKTAALLESCAVLGGLACETEEEKLVALKDFGRNLGLAFQVLDDWLGIWGNAAMLGKSTESDLISGKKTLPVLFGLSRKGAFYDRWLRGNILPEEAHDLAELLAQEGAKDYTHTMADRLTARALDALRLAIGNANEGCKALTQLTHELLNREQ